MGWNTTQLYRDYFVNNYKGSRTETTRIQWQMAGRVLWFQVSDYKFFFRGSYEVEIPSILTISYVFARSWLTQLAISYYVVQFYSRRRRSLWRRDVMKKGWKPSSCCLCSAKNATSKISKEISRKTRVGFFFAGMGPCKIWHSFCCLEIRKNTVLCFVVSFLF